MSPHFRGRVRARRRRLDARSTALAVALLCSTPAVAESPLDFSRALELAQTRSAALAAQDYASAAAHERALAARQLPDPALHFGIDDLPIDGPDRYSLTRDSFTARSLGLAQTFTRAEKRDAHAARYLREAELAQAERGAALETLRRETALAWLARHAYEQLREPLLHQRAEAQRLTDALEAAYRGARATLADVLAARSARAQADDLLDQNARDIASATVVLTRWVGEAGSAPLGLPPDTTRLSLDPARLERHGDTLATVAVAAGAEALALAEAQIARAERSADWSVELSYAQRGPAYSNLVSINFSLPLQWDRANRQDRELAARLAQAEQARALREEVRRRHVAEAGVLLAQWHSARARLARYDIELLPLAQQQGTAALAAYRGGSAALATVLTARGAESALRAERLRLALEAASLWAQLNYLLPDAGRSE